MPKRDGLKLLLDAARECYEVAATPPPSSLYPPTGKEPDEIALPDSRKTQLQFGIDCRYAVSAFCVQLTQDHGSKRVQRLIESIEGRYLNEYEYQIRKEILSDRKRLTLLIRHSVNRDTQ